MNELTMGTRRVGEFFDFHEATPSRQVLLERSEEGISLTLSWADPTSPYARWFLGDHAFSVSSDPPHDATSSQAPDRVLFVDSYGSVLLVRCYARGFHANLLGPGRGRLWARAAIKDVEEDLDFAQPHGLKTEISGLRDWLGVSSWDRRGLLDPQGEQLIRRQYPATVELGRFHELDLSLIPTWKVGNDGPDKIVLRDDLVCCTRASTGTPWRDHTDLHMALRDLLVLSRWRHESCVATSAFREDDPLRSRTGEPDGEQWRVVTVPDDELQSPPTGYRPHLIRYTDLGIVGIQRWVRLRRDYSRALEPIISSVELGPATHSTRLAQVGPGVEALGYLLLRRDGASKTRAGKSTLTERLQRIARDVRDVVPFDVDRWVTTTASSYNGIKHVNREEPNSIDVLNSWRECVLAMRAWVALELGVNHGDVRQRLKTDPQRHAFGELT